MDSKSVYLTFNEAIVQVLEGHKVTKAEWQNKDFYFLLKDEILMFHKPGESADTLHPLILSLADLVGKDYYVI